MLMNFSIFVILDIFQQHWKLIMICSQKRKSQIRKSIIFFEGENQGGSE